MSKIGPAVRELLRNVLKCASLLEKLGKVLFAVMERTVLPKKLSGGPHGLGDPDDKSLRKVELDVMVPRLMREKAKIEKCPQEVKDFTDCCRESSLAMVIMCRKENNRLKECLTHWYEDKGFRKECTEEYLRERSEYRRTGMVKKYRTFIMSEKS